MKGSDRGKWSFRIAKLTKGRLWKVAKVATLMIKRTSSRPASRRLRHAKPILLDSTRLSVVFNSREMRLAAKMRRLTMSCETIKCIYLAAAKMKRNINRTRPSRCSHRTTLTWRTWQSRTTSRLTTTMKRTLHQRNLKSREKCSSLRARKIIQTWGQTTERSQGPPCYQKR